MPPVIDPKMVQHMWRVSPAATAVTLSREDPVPFLPYRHQLFVSTQIRNAVIGTGPRFLIINEPPQFGKEIAHADPIFTPKGWRTHGELESGDTVFGRNGEQVKVLATSPEVIGDCEVEFTDGSVIHCHENHEWVVFDRRNDRLISRVYETKRMFGKEWLGDRKRGGRGRFQVDPNVSLELDGRSDLALDPYSLGVWLGDGTWNKYSIDCAASDHSIIAKIESLGHLRTWTYVHPDTGVVRSQFASWKEPLLKLGLLKQNKFIPGEYLLANKKQRLELLAGLVDTDGYVHQGNGRITFSNTNKRIIDAVAVLVRSLGWRISISEVEPVLSSSGIQGQLMVYQLCFNPTCDIPTVLDRKRINVKDPMVRRRSIVEIRKCEPRPGKCIQVEGGVYLVGETMIPTHNSTLGSKWTPLWFLENFPHKKVMVCGYGTQFASEFGAWTRNTVAAHKGTLSFELSEDSKAKDRWNTNMGGSMTSAGIGGQITGKGADLLVIDDPIKNSEEALSIGHREKVWRWWQTTASSRISKNAVVLVILTRWHEDDLAGRLTSREFNPEYCDKFHKIVLPAICDSTDDPLGRALGESLCPELFDVESLRFKMAQAGDEALALYQQKPRGEDGSGNVYDHYSDIENVMRVERDPMLPLDWCLDFNRDPFCTVLAQTREWVGGKQYLTNQKLIQVEVLKEIVRHDVSTEGICQAFIEETRKYVNQSNGQVSLNIFGDTSGNKRSTSADRTDWQIIKSFFKRYPEFKVALHVGTNNPPVKARVNSTNAALYSIDGYRRVKVDPSCDELRKDFKQVRWMRDTNGNTLSEVDKRDRKRTHASDALGYMIWHRLGIRESGGERSGLMQ